MTIEIQERGLPQNGMPRDALRAKFTQARAQDADPRATFCDRWQNDRELLVDDGTLDVIIETWASFATKNSSYPPILEMEERLVAMALGLFEGSPDAVGSVTSCGSESLFLAIASALAHVRRTRDVAAPKIVLPESAHPAFEKYAPYLGYEVVRTALDEDMRADPTALAAAIDDNTFMIACAMPSWTHGAVDPVPHIGQIAQKHEIWLHVDACVGGFLAPFLRAAGDDPGAFGFDVPGVASVSADYHKYGYGAKGVSGVFYRDADLARDQAFVFNDWAAGLYRSPVFTGTRSGGAVAASWAAALHLGQDGYLHRARQLMKARTALHTVAENSGRLRVLGGARMGTIALTGKGSEPINLRAVDAALRSRGWSHGFLKQPDALQFVLGPMKDAMIDVLVGDLHWAIDESLGVYVEGEPAVVYSDEILEGVPNVPAHHP